MKIVCSALLAIWLPLLALAGELSPAGLDNLPRADVVILGEVHDNPVHHLNQARAVASIKPAAVVFEMLTPEQAAKVSTENRTTEAALAKALQWEGTGWPDFKFYYPIFAAAPDAAIFGGNLPRGDVRRAIGEGAAKVFGEGAALFGLTIPLPPEEQSVREAEQMAAHCNALPVEMLAGMVEAQRLRDAALARAVLAARAKTGGTVVLITGDGHAQKDWGVPSTLKVAAPKVTVLSLGQFENSAGDTPQFDVYLVTEAAERADPCLAFQAKP